MKKYFNLQLFDNGGEGGSGGGQGGNAGDGNGSQGNAGNNGGTGGYSFQQAEEIAHMEAFIEKFRYKATKSKQVQDRVKKLEKIKRVELPEEKKTVKFNFK